MNVQGTRDLQERFTGEIYRVRFTCKRIMVLIVVLFSSLSRMSYIFEYICNCAKFDLRRSIVLVFAETSRLSYILKYICNCAKFVSSLGCLFALFTHVFPRNFDESWFNRGSLRLTVAHVIYIAIVPILVV